MEWSPPLFFCQALGLTGWLIWLLPFSGLPSTVGTQLDVGGHCQSLRDNSMEAFSGVAVAIIYSLYRGAVGCYAAATPGDNMIILALDGFFRLGRSGMGWLPSCIIYSCKPLRGRFLDEVFWIL